MNKIWRLLRSSAGLKWTQRKTIITWTKTRVRIAKNWTSARKRNLQLLKELGYSVLSTLTPHIIWINLTFGKDCLIKEKFLSGVQINSGSFGSLIKTLHRNSGSLRQFTKELIFHYRLKKFHQRNSLKISNKSMKWSSSDWRHLTHWMKKMTGVDQVYRFIIAIQVACHPALPPHTATTSVAKFQLHHLKFTHPRFWIS